MSHHRQEQNVFCVTTRIFFGRLREGKLRPSLCKFLKLPATSARATMLARRNADRDQLRPEK
jgi:hypothetical protein